MALPRPNTPAVREVRRRFSRELSRAAPDDVLEIAFELLERYGHRFVACELICYHRGALSRVRRVHLERLGKGLDSWSSVDSFATLVAGRVWRAGQVPDRLIHRWACSQDRGWRRAALVCTVPLNVKSQGGDGDADRTLAVCRLVVEDRDDMVEKGLSWALRELAIRDARSVRRFLREHRAKLAARVLREVRNKLDTGLKNPRKSETR